MDLATPTTKPVVSEHLNSPTAFSECGDSRPRLSSGAKLRGAAGRAHLQPEEKESLDFGVVNGFGVQRTAELRSAGQPRTALSTFSGKEDLPLELFAQQLQLGFQLLHPGFDLVCLVRREAHLRSESQNGVVGLPGMCALMVTLVSAV
jgi:hypothetical protein